MSKEWLSFYENGIYFDIEITNEKDVRLLNFSPFPLDKTEYADLVESDKKWYRIIELQVTGENQNDHHGNKFTGTSPGSDLKYISHSDIRNEMGRKLEICMDSKEIRAIIHYQFYDTIPVVRAWTELINLTDYTVGVEYISSFSLTGISKKGKFDWDDKSEVFIPHNTWKGELQWKNYDIRELGLSKVERFSMKRISCKSTGTWSTSELLPMGCYRNTESNECYFWQIENNGSWHWEIGDIADELYLKLSGPNERENLWWKSLKPKEQFQSVKIGIGTILGSFETAMQMMTLYRRKIIRKHDDNKQLPVIFNDYMNCLMGDPTTEKLIPLIDKAAEVGCEYFCIDAGWYSDGEWWDGVGEWLPSLLRFPNGLSEPINYIIEKGMIPGLWLEIESVGINCAIAQRVPDDWFFVRHGKRVVDHSRLQLDFRNNEVIVHATKIIDRLVNDYRVGYIKMDYNVEYGPGTELHADSFGDGLLAHNRAYLDWIDSIYNKYPNLIIENCGSGGCRMDYGMLSKHSIQSSSDCEDYKRYAYITAAAPSAVLPEQCACWSYPLENADKEDVIFNMVNVLLMRIHQSGHLANLLINNSNVVKEAISFYKSYREEIPYCIPVWPNGFPQLNDQWLVLGLENDEKLYLAVWRLDSENSTETFKLNIKENKVINLYRTFPDEHLCEIDCDKHGIFSIKMPSKFCARILEFNFSKID